MKSVLLLCSALILGGCVRLSENGFARAKLEADAQSAASIRLTDYTPFAWDRFHVFTAYTPPSVIKQEVGRRVPFPHVDYDEYSLLVFTAHGEIVAAFEMYEKPICFSPLFRKGGYSNAEAIFTIKVRPADGWRYLDKQTANQERSSQLLNREIR